MVERSASYIRGESLKQNLRVRFCQAPVRRIAVEGLAVGTAVAALNALGQSSATEQAVKATLAVVGGAGLAEGLRMTVGGIRDLRGRTRTLPEA